MRTNTCSAFDLGYCLNVHPGESWDAHFSAIQAHATRVRDRVAGTAPFGLGLRIANEAAARLVADEAECRRFAAWMRHETMYAFTINGFPYGAFHGTRVKEQVYAPDWQRDERRVYTENLAVVLSRWLPEGAEGSISTVPGSFKPWIDSPRHVEKMVEQWCALTHFLASLEDRTGHRIHVGIEPEPCCWLETTDECIAFYENELLAHGRHFLASMRGISPAVAEHLLRRHIGVCFDCCHLAIQFEPLAEALHRLQQAGILLSKIHLSAALRCTPSHREALRPFDEPVYFHQVKGRVPGDPRLRSWTDLGELPDTVPADIDELRVHFHVPLFWEGGAQLGTTADMMDDDFFRLLANGIAPHAEIETYTFDVLPPALRPPDIADSIAREFAWVHKRLHRLEPASPAPPHHLHA